MKRKRKPVHARRFIFKFYYRWEDFLWFVRINLCLIRKLRCLEFTLGLLGVGFLMQFYYGKRRIDAPCKGE